MKLDSCVKDSFWAKTEMIPFHDCWEWSASRTDTGYGKMVVNGRLERAHRVSYEMHFGPIPVGKIVMHKCDNRGCVNPHHLVVGTKKENAMDMVAKLRGTHGELQPTSKLTADLVLRIRSEYRPGYTTLKDIADKYGIVFQTVSAIFHRKLWRHLDEVR